jgi:hypothetical protein
MTLLTWRDRRNRLVREWHCCGLVWQLCLSPRWPQRWRWHPRCPRCHRRYGEVP